MSDDRIKEALFQNPRQEYGDQYGQHYLEMYKIYTSTVDSVSSRRQTANSFFLTVNTVLVTVVSYSNSCLQQQFARLLWLVAIAGIVLCYTWYRLIRSYRDLNGAKFKVIHLVEKQLPLAPYDAEWEAVGRGKDRKKYLPFTRVEIAVPWVFIGIYTLSFVLSFPWSPLCIASGSTP